MLFGELSQITGPEFCVGRDLYLYFTVGCPAPSTEPLTQRLHERVRGCAGWGQSTQLRTVLEEWQSGDKWRSSDIMKGTNNIELGSVLPVAP